MSAGGRNGRAIMAWPPDKIARFIRDWNEGVESPALRQRYGSQPDVVARRLRREGFDLISGLVRLNRQGPLSRDHVLPAGIPVLPVALNQKRL